MNNEHAISPPPSAADCDTVAPLLAAYALGEQDAAIRAAVEGHVRNCPACRQVLTETQAAVALLPLGVTEALPAPDLRARVLDAVAVAAHPAPPARRIWAWRRHAPWRRQLFWRRAFLGALLIVLLGWNVQLQRALNRQLAVQQRQQALLSELLYEPGVERNLLVADAPAPNAQGALIVAPDRRSATLFVQDLPQLPPNRVYQLWLANDDERISGGTFTVNSNGYGVLAVRPPRPLNAYKRCGVTIEPTGGSSGPTTTRVIGCPTR